MSNSPVRTIRYGSAPINDFHIAAQNAGGGVTEMEVGGHRARPSERFWTSLCVNYSNQGLNTKLFRLFQHQEVFQRLTDRLGGKGGDRLRYAVEELEDGTKTLLAVSKPTSALLEYEPARAMVTSYAVGELGVSYGKGVVLSTHQPPNMDDVKVGGDTFSYRYVTETPIDGYGKPLVYLALLRQVCTNGAIGYARAFRSEVSLGKADANSLHALERALQSFNNEEGYAALTSRIEAATNSWASINECGRLYDTVSRMGKAGLFHAASGETDVQRQSDNRTLVKRLAETDDPTTVINRAYINMTGDIPYLYDVASMDAFSERRKRQLPARCSVYDLINLTTEIATHYCKPSDARALHGLVGTLVSEEFDLEGTMESKKSYTDWFTDLSASPHQDDAK